MDLALTEDQEMLRTTARTFMEREAPVDVVVGLQKAESSLDPDLWAKAARLGWLGVVLPGGIGGRPVPRPAAPGGLGHQGGARGRPPRSRRPATAPGRWPARPVQRAGAARRA